MNQSYSISVHVKGCSCPVGSARCLKVPKDMELEIRATQGVPNFPSAKKESALRLEPGKFYRSRDGGKWCCFRVDLRREEHCRADCVNTEGSGEVEYFYLDGRYDTRGLAPRTLVEECDP